MATLTHSDKHGLWMHFATFEGPTVECPDVTLIPMVHVANRDFLCEAYAETWRYDFALYEGAYIPLTSIFRHIYPLIAKALGLTPQGSGKISLKRQGWKREHETAPRERIMVKTFNTADLKLSRRQKQIIADMDKKGFSEAIKDMPLSAKLAFPFLLVAFLLSAPFMAKRENFFDIKDEVGEFENPDFFERCLQSYFKYVLEDRDAFLKKTLKEQIEKCRGHNLSICVQYGQAHMKSLVAFLHDEMNYETVATREVLAVSREKRMSLKGLKTGYGEAYAAYKHLPSNMSDKHQKYDRKMISTEARLAAWDKVCQQEKKKRTQTPYPFSREKVMRAWASCTSTATSYKFPTEHEALKVGKEFKNEDIDEVKGYSMDTEYSHSKYSLGYSKPSSSFENPLEIDKSLVYVVKTKTSAT